ncbi:MULTISPECIES: WD40 repeat domain-containing protein [unclassified Streptomyces]|uniref:WD40 repeat domain-containing protein n=1 Tax=unclassified Streptomyces TaxID=2593676 RepID=UPI00225752CB|nr:MULTISPECIES: WD40 repeat domain-containing protein [unclassified Streptomyces]MCX5056229.1 WD40 repeat domain-containing protein [Streptomyces sp. NBC_00452]MCX5287333.1 WD40 repeat domain-containing protein [Streptomyces sp. NBC_00183]
MRRPFAVLAGVLLVGAFALPVSTAAPASASDGDGKGDQGFTIKDPRITESSGLAASRLHPGIYWTHNDSADGPYIYAVDSSTGRTVARITLSGIGAPRDVEAISIGPDHQIYVGDIGDNLGGKWPYVWIYQLPEPKKLVDQTVRATQYIVKYADGARNAESLVVDPKTGRPYIIDKNEDGGHLYEGPAKLSASGTNIFKPVAAVDLWATDAAISPNGEQLAVRGYFGGIYYDWNGGKIKRKGRLDVPLQGQGESVTYSADGSKLMYGSEGNDSPVQAEDPPGGGSGSGSKSPSGSGSSSASGASGGGAGGTLKVGALAVAVAAAVVFGFRRLLRRN